MATEGTLRNAAIGALVTIVLSFTGFSPLLGGGVAGYLQREPPKRGAKVGAISGAIATLPFVLVLVLGLGLFVGFPTARMGTPGLPELLVIVFVLFPLLFLWNIGLSALGGYLGAYIRTDTRPPSQEPSSPELR